MSKTVIGVMGGSDAAPGTVASARELGRLIAERGWVLLSGGRPTGVMQASVAGAHAAGGLTVGVLFDDDPDQAAEGLDIIIPTGMGAARNVVNILASHVVVACRGNGGTLSEIALALRFNRPLVLLDFDPGTGFLDDCAAGGATAKYCLVQTPEEAVDQVASYLMELGLES